MPADQLDRQRARGVAQCSNKAAHEMHAWRGFATDDGSYLWCDGVDQRDLVLVLANRLWLSDNPNSQPLAGQCGSHRARYERLADVALGGPVFPHGPAEPDDGTVLSWVSGTEEVWVARRADDCAVDENNWLVGAEGELRDWPWLLSCGAASAVRLWSAAELIPDPDDREAANEIAQATHSLLEKHPWEPHSAEAEYSTEAAMVVLRVLRARAESRTTPDNAGGEK